MDFSDISFIFNRSLAKSFEKKKSLLVFLVLLLCGLLVVFFRGASLGAGYWMKQSFTFLPLFLCGGVLLSTGIMLIRIYHDEIKGKEVSYKEVFGKSWEIIIGASYFAIPIVLSYLLLWVTLGLFLLFEQIPFIGSLFSVILAFGPFLLNFGSIILCLLNLALLFYAAPALALKGLSGMHVSRTIMKRFQHDVFGNLLLAITALLPLLTFLVLLSIAGVMAGSLEVATAKPLFSTMRWLFMMIPFVAILTPSIIFFFNFAAESHVLMIKVTKEKKI